jgi:LAO/AO transport system kinase
MPTPDDKKPLINADTLRKGDFHLVARAVSLVENSGPGAEELLKSLRHTHVPIIGITGPPGAGKSTLVDALIKQFIDDGKKLAVLCVDPSSSFHSGAILGDRIRMNQWYNNSRVFIRSLASRGAMGGLHPRIFQITDLLAHAGFDYILIETVGVGQSEIDISRLADQVVLVLVPESGDDIQTMKSGIMEIGDIFVVNKSDRPGAEQFLTSLKSSLHYRTSKRTNEIKFIQTVATERKGVEELYQAIREYSASPLAGRSIRLLTEKTWQLISGYRMRDLDDKKLQHLLEHAMSDPDFNIYRFAESMSGKSGFEKSH